MKCKSEWTVKTFIEGVEEIKGKTEWKLELEIGEGGSKIRLREEKLRGEEGKRECTPQPLSHNYCEHLQMAERISRSSSPLWVDRPICGMSPVFACASSARLLCFSLLFSPKQGWLIGVVVCIVFMMTTYLSSS